MCHKVFHLYIFHDSNPPRPWIYRLKYFRIWFWFRRDIRSPSSKVSTPRCARHQGVKILGLVNPLFILQIFSFMIDVFTHKKIFLLVPLRVPETSKVFDSDSAVWCTLQCVTAFRVRLCSVMPIAQPQTIIFFFKNHHNVCHSFLFTKILKK